MRYAKLSGATLAGGVVGLMLVMSCGDSQSSPGSSAGAGGQYGQHEAGGPSGAGADVGSAAAAGQRSSGGGNATGGTSETSGGSDVAEPTAGQTSSGGTGGTTGVDGGAGGEGNTGGWGGDCLVGVPAEDAAAGAPAVLLADAGDTCPEWGALACAGENQKQNLVCRLGTWELFQVCAESENCDRRTGRCEAILPECAAEAPGFLYCEDDALKQCGADRVTAATSVCCGACSAGECRAPRCGDGRKTAAESCDDGNRHTADGCDSDCERSAVLQLVAGSRHTCALLREGRVRCWGDNQEGQLGRGDGDRHGDRHPHELGLVELGGRVTQLVVGSRHTCALLTDGSVSCWGANEHGQLGLGHTAVVGDDEVPDAKHARVALGAKARRLSAGGESTCALLTEGQVRCWGRNDFGQLGLGHQRDIGDDEVPSSENANVLLGTHTAVAAGQSGEHLCVALENRRFACWGDDTYEQLDYMRGWDLSGGSPVVDIIGSGWRTYTMLDDNPRGLFAAGYNLDGLLGAGGATFPDDPSDAIYLRGQYGTVQASAGPKNLCYIEANQTLRCVGSNDRGQLGFADRFDRYFSEVVSLGKDAQQNPVWPLQVGTGGGHSCVWVNTGVLRCWGMNDEGQLGLGYESPSSHDYVGGTVTDNAATATAVRLFHE